jgi:hypothetical protein
LWVEFGVKSILLVSKNSSLSVAETCEYSALLLIRLVTVLNHPLVENRIDSGNGEVLGLGGLS